MKIPKEYFFIPERYSGAKSWDEMSASQLVRACHILDSEEEGIWKVERLVAMLMNIYEGSIFIAYEDAVALTKFIFDGTTRTAVPFSKIKMGWRKKDLYPPKDRLSNITFGEFIKADNAFNKFTRTGETAYLDRLCAILYRPKKTRKEIKARDFNGDVREPFNSNTLEPRVLGFQKVSKAEKLAVMTYFAGSKAKMAKSCPHIFTKPEGNSEESTKGNTWMNALHSFTDNITQYDPVLETRANLVLFEMNMSAKEAKEHNEYLESLK